MSRRRRRRDQESCRIFVSPLREEHNDRPTKTVFSERHEQKKDLALAYILTYVDDSCKAIGRQVKCPRNEWTTLKEMFESVGEASIDAKTLQLQAVVIRKGEDIVNYSRQIQGLVSELEIAGHVVSEMAQKQALFRGLPEDYEVTVELVITFKHIYIEAFSKLIVGETRQRNAE